MKTDHVIEKLNEAVSLEFGAFHMYLQFSFLVHGQDRLKWHEFFEANSQEALGHAKLFAKKIVALGGVPTVRDAPFKQSLNLTEMLALSLETEKRAVKLYSQIHALVGEQDAPLKYLLEQQILDEQSDVEEIEKFLRAPITARSSRATRAMIETSAHAHPSPKPIAAPVRTHR